MDLASAQAVLVSGIVLGSLYAMMATGLSLIWTTLGIFNFAHGVFMTLGAYVAWQVSTSQGFGIGAAAGVALGVAALFGLGCLSELLLVRRFLKQRDVVMIAVITTLAAAIFLENAIQLLWGPKLKQLPPLIEGNVRILGVAISAHEAVILGVAPTTLLILYLFLKSTRLGSAVRAVGQNRELSALLGMNERVLFALSFGLAAALAALAGILLGSRSFITPELGNEPLVKALIVAIFGGLSSLMGTIGGAYIIGLMEAFCMYFVGLYWTPAVLFLVMITTLLIRPTGLFGRR